MEMHTVGVMHEPPEVCEIPVTVQSGVHRSAYTLTILPMITMFNL